MKNLNKLRVMFLALAMTTFFIIPSVNAQTVEHIEKMEDGTLMLQVDGVVYRGLAAPHLRQIITNLEKLKVYEENDSLVQQKFDEFRLAVQKDREALIDLHVTELGKRDEQVKFYQSEFEKEKVLRLKYQKTMESCTGKIIFFRICTR
jgi:ATP-dependent helicase YprA (DUF1998 family)